MVLGQRLGIGVMVQEANAVGGGMLRTVNLLDNEKIGRTSWTTYSRGWLTGVTGKLFLTDRRLILCPLRYPIPIAPAAFYLSEIRGLSLVEWSDWAWLWHRMAPLGSIRLVVDQREHWFFLGREKSRIWIQELAQATGLIPTHGS